MPRIDLLIAIDWIYLCTVNVELYPFLMRYKTAMNPGAHVLFDMVDSAFNAVPGNEYRTDDWHLALHQQRPTQYRLRMGKDEVISAITRAGFVLVEAFSGTEIPPRFVYVIKLADR